MAFHQQYHLKGKGFSGRAVICRELDPSEVEDNVTAAAKLVDKDATVIEFKKTEWRNGVKLMVVKFSEPCADPLAEGVKWKDNSAGLLDDLGTYFTSKDVGVLQGIFRNFHEVSEDELNDIVGKALPVSAG